MTKVTQSVRIGVNHIKTVTVEQILLWEPCDEYTHDIITGLFAGREQLSALDILELDIPVVDRLWAVLREELIPANILHEFACKCAENALMRERKAGREPDPRSWAAIYAKRRWLKGEITDEELTEARDVARAIGVGAMATAIIAEEVATTVAAWDMAGVGTKAKEQVSILKRLLV